VDPQELDDLGDGAHRGPVWPRTPAGAESAPAPVPVTLPTG